MTRSRWCGKFWSATLDKCHCGGYHFPHRTGSGACIHSPRADYYMAKRAGLSEAEALATLAVHILEAMIPLSITHETWEEDIDNCD